MGKKIVNQSITASGDSVKGTITLNQDDQRQTMVLLGTSLPCNHASGDETTFLSFSTAKLEEDKTGLIVIANGGVDENSPPKKLSFLEVIGKEGTEGYWINLEKHWIPPSDRMPRTLKVDDVYGIQVEVGESTFSTIPVNGSVLTDATLLCRYLNGEIDKDELLHGHAEWEKKTARRAKVKEIVDYLLGEDEDDLAERFRKLQKEMEELQVLRTLPLGLRSMQVEYPLSQESSNALIFSRFDERRRGHYLDKISFLERLHELGPLRKAFILWFVGAIQIPSLDEY